MTYNGLIFRESKTEYEKCLNLCVHVCKRQCDKERGRVRERGKAHF